MKVEGHDDLVIDGLLISGWNEAFAFSSSSWVETNCWMKRTKRLARSIREECGLK